MVWVANGENRSETCEYALTPGSVPYRALTRLRASPRPAAGKNWPSLEAVRPVPQTALMPSGEQHVEQADAVATGRPGSQVREGLGELGGVVHLEQDVRDPRVGDPLVEVGDEVAGPVRHGGFGPFDAEHAIVDAGARDRAGSRRGVQPAQAFVQRELALGEPVLRAGRNRQAAVGISNSGNRGAPARHRLWFVLLRRTVTRTPSPSVESTTSPQRSALHLATPHPRHEQQVRRSPHRPAHA